MPSDQDRANDALGPRLGPSTELHGRIARAVDARFKKSWNDMSLRHTEWSNNEERHISYIPKADADRLRDQKRDQDGVQQYSTIVIPYSYAMVMSAHTYFTSTLLSRSPIFQYTERHGQVAGGANRVEALINYQVQAGAMLPSLYVWTLDPLKYGFGILGTYWNEDFANVSEFVREPKKYLGIEIPGTSVLKKRVQRIRTYAGAKTYNVNPRDFFPDTRVPLSQFHTGEFCCRLVNTSWNDIIRREAAGYYFNIDWLKKARMTTVSNEEDTGSSQIDWPSGTDLDYSDTLADVAYVKLLEAYIDIIPKDWKLGSGEMPEKWVFTCAMTGKNVRYVIGAQPLGELHDRFPMFIQQYEVDGYALHTRSMYDILQPLQDTMNWLVNSHFYNIRASLNNMLVVDPSRLVLKDVLRPGPGKIIRARPSSYGQDVRLAYSQLQVNDVTQNNMRDLEHVAQMMQRAVGVTDSLMGMMAQGGRRTATETRQSTSLSINRLKSVTEYWSATAWKSFAEVLLQMSQQHYDEELEFKIAGDLTGEAGALVKVGPEEIAGRFDYIPSDGNMPVDRSGQLVVWTQLLAQARQIPGLLQGFDLTRLFSYMAQLGGLNNVDQFKVQVVPDAVAQRQAATGQLIPVRPGGAAPSQAGDLGPIAPQAGQVA